MIIEGVLAAVAALVNARGAYLALNNRPKSSTWFALGAALFIGLSTQFADSFEVTAILLTLAAVDLSAAGGLVAREVVLRRDQRLSQQVADDAAVRELMRDVDQEDPRRRVAPPEDVDES